MQEPVVIEPDTLDVEEWDDKSKGEVTWKTLISSDRTPSSDIICGLAYFGPCHKLARHRHRQPEIVHVVDGGGMASFDGEQVVLRKGTTIFVPSNISHEFVADTAGLTLFYTFAVSAFTDIEYQFQPDQSQG